MEMDWSKYTRHARRFENEHKDACTGCGRGFLPGETTHLGRNCQGRLAYVGDCCSSHLSSLIVRHSHTPTLYSQIVNNVVLWRFMDLAKFISMLKEQALYFPRADQFEDPLEGAKGLLKNKRDWDSFYRKFFEKTVRNPPDGIGFDKTDDEVRREVKRLLAQFNDIGNTQQRSTFISCWHENPHESEAMWRLYTTALPFAVAVQTTRDKLYRALHRNPDITIGRVSYLDYESQFANINGCYWNKRKSFEHEREVRAILVDHTAGDVTGKLMPTNLRLLIDHIYVSPVAPAWFRALVVDVTRRYEVRKRIVQSSLNAIPFR